MKIKNWFERKLLEEHVIANCMPFIESINGVVSETEKAYQLSITYGYTSNISRTMNTWVPKSCTMTDEEAEQEENEMIKKFEDGLLYNIRLLTFAKENLVKGVRKGMRTSTLIKKIQEAGLEVPARA